MKSDDGSGQLSIGEIGAIDTEFTEWDDSSTSVTVDTESATVTDIADTKDTSEIITPAEIIAVIPTAADLYDPSQENIENAAVLQRFQQFKATFNSPDIPNHVLLEMLETMLKADNSASVAVGIPDDFDPFADEAA